MASARGTEITSPGMIPATHVEGLSEDRLRVGIARVARQLKAFGPRRVGHNVEKSQRAAELRGSAALADGHNTRPEPVRLDPGKL